MIENVTPGKWIVRHAGHGDRSGGFVISEYTVMRYGDDVAIASDIVDPESNKPSKANANLISAAKELGEAAQLGYELSMYAASSRLTNTPEFLEGLFERISVLQPKAERALSKANGEVP